MAIAFQDFAPAVTHSGYFSSDYEPLTAVVARANEWMANVGARVVNVETVLLPNLSDGYSVGQASGLSRASSKRCLLRDSGLERPSPFSDTRG